MTSIIVRFPLAVLVAAMLILQGCQRPPTAPSENPTGLPVEVQKATTAEMRLETSLTGTIKTRQDVTITASLSEDVTAVNVREGDIVKAGQPLILLDQSAVRSRLSLAQAGLKAAQNQLALLRAGARDQERAVAQNAVIAAKSNLDKAQLDLERVEQLYKEGAAPKEQLDSARTYYEVAKTQYESALQQANLVEEGARKEQIEAAVAAVEQAQAAVVLAQNDLSNTVLRSPIAGTVYFRAVNVGDVPMMGAPLLKIAALNDIYFLATVPEKDFASLSVKQAVSVTADALPAETFSGHIERLVPVADSESREFLARIAVDNSSQRLRPGMFTRGKVLLETHPNAVVVPSMALLERNGEKSLFAVNGNTAELRSVTTGIENTSLVEIRSGISAGEEVITVGQKGLKSGDQISIVRRGAESK